MGLDDASNPWYPWYWKDWRANRRVARMTPAERGIYRELLDECWVEGSLPADLEGLAEVARCTLDEMAAAWPAIKQSLTVRPGDGRLVNVKITAVRAAQEEAYARRVQAGRIAGLASGRKRLTTNDPSTIANDSSTTVNHKSRIETTLNSKGPPLNGAAPLPATTYGPRDKWTGEPIPEDGPGTPPTDAEKATWRAELHEAGVTEGRP